MLQDYEIVLPYKVGVLIPIDHPDHRVFVRSALLVIRAIASHIPEQERYARDAITRAERWMDREVGQEAIAEIADPLGKRANALRDGATGLEPQRKVVAHSVSATSALLRLILTTENPDMQRFWFRLTLHHVLQVLNLAQNTSRGDTVAPQDLLYKILQDHLPRS